MARFSREKIYAGVGCYHSGNENFFNKHKGKELSSSKTKLLCRILVTAYCERAMSTNIRSRILIHTSFKIEYFDKPSN